MDGLSRVAGGTTGEITIGGETYTLRPLTLGHYRDLEAYIVSLRPNPLVEAVRATRGLPAEEREPIIAAAYNQLRGHNRVSAAEVAAFESDLHGLAWKFWRMLLPNRAGLTLDGAFALIEQLAAEARIAEVQAAMEQANAEAELKNSAGPATTGATTAASPGPGSTSSSPSDSAGPSTVSTN